MRIPSFLVAFSLVAIASTTPALSAKYTATLLGANEVPPRATPGTGNVTVLIVGDEIAAFGSFANLLPLTSGGMPSGTVAAHIHCCVPPTTNAGVATQLPSFPGFPLGVTSASFNVGPFDLNSASTYNSAFITGSGGTVAGARTRLITGLNAGQAYFNIHTNAFPGGEIRGQLSLVPEPATWAMMIAGFGIVGAALRRRRRPRSGLAAA